MTKNKEIDLINDPKLRAKHIDRVELLDRVGKLQTLPKAKCSTTKQIAEFYGVESGLVHTTIARNREEIHSNGVRKADYHNLKGRLFEVAGSTQAWKVMRRNLGIAYSDTNLYPKQAVLLIGFMLEGSEVADKVRKLVLANDDIFEPVKAEPVNSVGAIAIPNEQPKITDLQVVNHNEQLVIDSRDVAEMVGRQHNDLLKTIRNYVDVLGQGDFTQSDFFIENTYQNSQNKAMPCYLLTRKGCDMVANKMTGAKGILFTATYVTRFEEMENQLKNQAVVPVHSYMIENPIERAKMWIVEQEEKMLLEVKVQEQNEVIEYKQSIIEGYANEIPFAEKRQILVNLIRSGCFGNGYAISKRWTKLYKEFNMLYHKNISVLTKNHNEKYGTKLAVIDYVEQVLGMFDELYNLGMKYFAVDAEKTIEQQKKLLLVD